MYHWTTIDGRLGNGDGRQVVVGETLMAFEEIKLCACGMHASARIIDALNYAPGPRLWEVELKEERIDGKDKSVAFSRRAIRDFGDQTEALIEFARWCADLAKEYAATNRTDVVTAWAATAAASAALKATVVVAWTAAAIAAANAAASAAVATWTVFNDIWTAADFLLFNTIQAAEQKKQEAWWVKRLGLS